MDIYNTQIFGLDESITYSGLPKSTFDDMPKFDMKRAKKLAGAPSGSGHDCFLKGITVQTNVIAPQYWWLQFGRYHFADIVSSQSKMHSLLEMNIDKHTNKYVDESTKQKVLSLASKYAAGKISYQRLIANVPMGFLLEARITTNFLQLKTIYKQRKNHKLIEWYNFCEWISDLFVEAGLVLDD